MAKYFHSIRLEESKCRGCTNCIKKCPTEAIRVRDGKAYIISDRCIDCGECVRACPYQAKRAKTDKFEHFDEFKYRIALPAPSLYAQFSKKYTRRQILAALQQLGFDYVYEVARAAEIVSEETKRYLMEKDVTRPVISSACPVIVRFIMLKYPNLIPHISHVESPMQVAGEIARNEFAMKHKVNPDDIGVFFISPCAAKRTAVKAPIGKKKSSVDYVISIKSVYFKLRKILEDIKEVEMDVPASKFGVRWANTGGESLALKMDNFIAVDGIHNVAEIFEAIEDEAIEDIDFVEALACTGGCLGGPLCIENVYTARAVFKKILEKDISQIPFPCTTEKYNPFLDKEIIYNDVYSFGKDMNSAMAKVMELGKLIDDLPGLDCGACGAPSCRALAEDIVRGYSTEDACIVRMKENYRELLEEGRISPRIDKNNNEET